MNLIVIKKALKSKNYKMLVWVFFMLIVLASCSKDDEPEEVIYHQSYVKGKLNDAEISMNDVNALVSSTKSDYSFIVRENEEKVSMFDWNVKLIDTSDSIVTLFLHLDNISRTNSMIASPNNDPASVQTKDKCYITAKDIRTGKSTTYTPTEHSQISAEWNYFTVTSGRKTEKHNGVTWDYSGTVWSGINGRLYGTFINSSAPNQAIKLNINFKLY